MGCIKEFPVTIRMNNSYSDKFIKRAVSVVSAEIAEFPRTDK
jgi:hypothetical protein